MIGIGNRRLEGSAGEVHIYVDLSNVYLGAQEAARRHGDDSFRVRLHADRLLQLLSRGRTVATATVIANDIVPDAMRSRFRAAGYAVEVREAGIRTRTEQANDEALLVRMYETITAPTNTGTIILVSGDGNGWQQGHGFATCLQRAGAAGLRTEVASWSGSLNGRLGAVADHLELLDDAYYGITFVEGGRTSQPIINYPRPIGPSSRAA